ncbi:NAD(P)H-dependent oxidoreductase [Roseobacter litoralis]|uniref:Flavodoxin-like protein n=1 Tax=Roseobacter litoralis (strain ATCC 49566 / DSM 6996 / JCM 21268 / NBRC 15278 / OCh 149) TaxID=391595 RepID=F7ZEU8_ROSLO|nr:NAD(P)H-dependent oxidoreductase [Roseobacter litoralis]AEI92179.1 flavodoxin-like protein [Roseobacter litoralis Och 149]
MHVLTVLDHPNPTSFSAAVAQRFMEGAQAAGHTVELTDLHAEGFNPLWSMEDIERDAQARDPADVVAEQARIERADALCLVFPLFWWGMPSMMKGWVDRVWTWGWAYDQLDDPNRSLLRPRSGVLLVPAGARSDEMDAAGYKAALETVWMNGTFGYFGLSPRRLEVLNGSSGSDARRQALMDRSYDAGFTLLPPDPAV